MTAESIGSLAASVVNDLAERTGRPKPFMETPMPDDYAHWRDNLAGKAVLFHDGDPQPGFYRKRKFKGGPYVPVAIWRDGETMRCVVDGREDRPEEIWTFICRYPISEETYRAVAERGEQWPDLDPAVAAIGHNAPTDDLDELRDQIESAKAGADDYASIADDETQARAQSLRSRLLELSREADKRREAEKKPHLEAGKAVDAKYQPLVKDAKGAADAIAKAMGAYETAKARAAAEAARKAEEERRRREEEVRKAEEAGRPAPTPVAVPDPEPAPAPSTQVRGGYGRAASVRVVKVVTDVTDWNLLFGFLQSHPELKDLMRKLAQRAVDKGHEVPGVTVEEERKVA